MLWSLIMEPQRRYTQVVKKSFHVTMAALDISTASTEPIQVMCGVDEHNYLLCTLQKDKVLQCNLDLYFEKEEKISFMTNGDCNIHLTGYLVDEDLEDLSDDEEEAEEEVAANLKRKVNITESEPKKKKSKTSLLLENIPSTDEDDDDADVNLSDLLDGDEEEEEEDEDEEEQDSEDVQDEEEDDVEEEELSEMSGDEDEQEEVLKTKKVKANKMNGNVKKQNKEEKKKQSITPLKNNAGASQKTTPKSAQKQQGSPDKEQDSGSPQKRTIAGGVVIQDIKSGNGPVAKPGRLVQVYYVGRFKQNNKVFDSANKGPGFKFRLGKQEVIKGWDVGVAGMKVGGKRRITCPPPMAYGQKGSPPAIPPNSTLVFDVELKSVN